MLRLGLYITSIMSSIVFIGLSAMLLKSMDSNAILLQQFIAGSLFIYVTAQAAISIAVYSVIVYGDYIALDPFVSKPLEHYKGGVELTMHCIITVALIVLIVWVRHNLP